MRQNLWWAAGYNVIAFPLAAGVLYPMRMQDLSQFGFTEVLFPGLAPDADE